MKSGLHFQRELRVKFLTFTPHGIKKGKKKKALLEMLGLIIVHG
jgi:hypothetical protein